MKLQIELCKSKNDVTQVYRNVLDKRAKSVEIIKDEANIVMIEVVFYDDELFETLVKEVILCVDFQRVYMLNDGDEKPEESEESEVEEAEGNGADEENIFEERLCDNFEESAGQESDEDASLEEPSEEYPGGDVADEETGEEPVSEEESAPQGENVSTGQVAPAEENVEETAGENIGEEEAAGPDEKANKPQEGKVKVGRKREGEEIKNLFVIPTFPRDLTLENVLGFFGTLPETVRESMVNVVAVALDVTEDCAMDWKDVVRVAAKKGHHLTTYDKTKAAKKVSDVFEEHGYSIRLKGFLRLLRAHAEGKLKDPNPKEEKPVENPAPKLPEPAKVTPAAPVIVTPPKNKSRLDCIDYNEDFEEKFNSLWDEGCSLDELLCGLFEFFAEEELPENEIEYLRVCADAVALDNLDSVYIDMGVRQFEARAIQANLASKLESFLDRNGMSGVRLYDFIEDVRSVYNREA